MTIHPTLLRLSAILPILIAVVALILFAFEFEILDHGGPAKAGRQKLELEEISLIGAILTAALSVTALINRSWMIREHKKRSRAEQEATTDALTGIANRRHFLRTADQKLAQAARLSQRCAVLLIDLDRFKPVNDTFGHAAGDAVLVAVAQRLDHALPVEHCAGRLGGDEFAILLGPGDDLRIEYCVEQIAACIARPVAFAGHSIDIGASIGIAVTPEDGANASSLIAAADERMYIRKRGGRRRVEIAAAA
jgi:diguanylate cyclase (GGDEF)-like protein